MGFDMRVPSGRCSSLLLASCVLLYIVLLCSWWSLSSQNYDLINKIDILEDQMKICCAASDQCANDKNKLEVFTRELKIQSDLNKIEHETASKKTKNTLLLCKTELESLKVVDASKTQSLNALRSTLEEKKEKFRLLTEQIKQLTSVTTDVNVSKAQKSSNTMTYVKDTDINNDRSEAVEGTTEILGVKQDGDRDQEMASNTN